MATKTYLQLVNDVLVRLREDQVLSVTDSNYSTLVGSWVNDAKRMVEDAWDWQCLVTPVTVNIVADTLDYTLTGLNERSRIVMDTENPYFPMAFDTTASQQSQLLKAPINWIRTQKNLQTTTNYQSRPIYFGVTKTAGGVSISLFETPTESRTWSLYFVRPQDELSADADVLSVPYAPVVQIALLHALDERGEEIGEPGTTVEDVARVHIANAIAIDAQEEIDKVTFYPG